MVEALGTREVPAEPTAILTAHYRTVHKDRTALILEKRSGQGIYSFLKQLEFGGGPSTRAGAGDGGQSRPGRTGASHALAIFRPG